MDKWQDLSKGGFQPGDYSLSCGKRGKREDACLQRKQGGGGECLEGFSVSGSSFLRHDCFPASDVFCGFFLLVILRLFTHTELGSVTCH